MVDSANFIYASRVVGIYLGQCNEQILIFNTFKNFWNIVYIIIINFRALVQYESELYEAYT